MTPPAPPVGDSAVDRRLIGFFQSRRNEIAPVCLPVPVCASKEEHQPCPRRTLRTRLSRQRTCRRSIRLHKTRLPGQSSRASSRRNPSCRLVCCPYSIPELYPRHTAGWGRVRKVDRSSDARLGCLATVAALLGASSALQKGNRTQFNMFLRYRVAAQGLTLIAALGTPAVRSAPALRSINLVPRPKSADSRITLLGSPSSNDTRAESPRDRWLGVLWRATEGSTRSRPGSKSGRSRFRNTNPRLISCTPLAHSTAPSRARTCAQYAAHRQCLTDIRAIIGRPCDACISM